MAKALLLGLGVLLAVAAGPLAAAPAKGVGRGHVSQGDWQFMRDAAAADHAAIAAGKLAGERARQASVRDFGATLVQDHTAINRKLYLLTLDKQVPLPSRPAGSERKALRNLKDGGAENFDRAFAQHAAQLERQLADLFRKEADSATADPALREIAQEFLPRLQKDARGAMELATRSTAP